MTEIRILHRRTSRRNALLARENPVVVVYLFHTLDVLYDAVEREEITTLIYSLSSTELGFGLMKCTEDQSTEMMTTVASSNSTPRKGAGELVSATSFYVFEVIY